jgi:ketosteroid isomerase-like protein
MTHPTAAQHAPSQPIDGQEVKPEFSSRDAIDWANRFIESILQERIPDIIAGYDPSDETYVFLEGPRWSTKTGERVAYGWAAFVDSPIKMVGKNWVEGPFAQVSGDLAWVAGILDMSVTAAGQSLVIRFRGTYVLRQLHPDVWGIVHEHFSQPTSDPYGVGDWLPKP